MASTPHHKHVYNVPNFDMIQEVQKQIITEVCSGVDDQLNSLVSGEESESKDPQNMLHCIKWYSYYMKLFKLPHSKARFWYCIHVKSNSPFKHFLNPYNFSSVVEPAFNLQVTEISSKSMRVTWDASLGDVSGYKLILIPMLPGMKRQELYMGATQTSINVRDLSPETEYEISLYALKGLTPSEPVMAMEKTQPVKVSTGKVICRAWPNISSNLFICKIYLNVFMPL